MVPKGNLLYCVHLFRTSNPFRLCDFTSLICIGLDNHFESASVFERGVLVVGQTGGGKSSLINAFIKEYDFQEKAQYLQESGGALQAVTWHTTEVNVTVRIWNAPDSIRPGTHRPLVMGVQFYDTRRFLDHYTDAGKIANGIKRQCPTHGPVMHTLLIVIKVGRMGPLTRLLHSLLRCLPQGTGIMLVLTYCNDLNMQVVGLGAQKVLL